MEIMARIILLTLLLSPLPTPTIADGFDTIRLCTYNLLQFGGDDLDRTDAFLTVLREIDPDILVVQGLTSQEGWQLFLDSVMKKLDPDFETAPWYDGPDTDNGFFYKADVIRYVRMRVLETAPRHTGVYTIQPARNRETGGDSLDIFVAHFKSGNTPEDEASRLEASTTIRVDPIARFPVINRFILLGTLNFHSAYPSYANLVQVGMGGNFFSDPILDVNPETGMPDSIAWHDNPEAASVHTCSTRVRQVDGGAGGGLRDRFDFILFMTRLTSQNRSEIRYIPGSCRAFGNDGRHFGASINAGSNAVVSAEVSQALHDASDHLPVYADIVIEYITVPATTTSRDDSKKPTESGGVFKIGVRPPDRKNRKLPDE